MRRTLVFALALTLLAPSAAQTSPDAVFSGTVTDGPTGSPIEGALVRVGDAMTVTDARGEFSFRVPAGEQVLEVVAPLPDGRTERVRQVGLVLEDGAEHWRDIRLVTGAFLDEAPMLEQGIGVPLHRDGPEWPDVSEPVDLLELWLERRQREGGPTLDELRRLELPDPLPETIRVLRRWPNACSGTDYPITEVDLDTYAAGVVTAEIGVFRALTTGEDSQAEGFKALAIAGRSYGLWFWARDPDASWHLDDTACNQRYTDGPYPDIIWEAAQATSGQILVQAGTEAVIDKFEYAASCGRCGTRPEYQDELVPDQTGENACTTGGWCGHNNCAAHEDNPNCPINGGDRCLVRGICQWGLAERSARGDTYLDILGHYQPNLDVRDFDEPTPARLLGFVRVGDVDTGDAVAGAEARLDGGDLAITGASGLYTFDSVIPGTRTLSVSAEGFEPVERTIEVEPGIDNWNSVALTPLPVDDVGPDPTPDTGPVADAGDAGPPDSGPPPDAGGGEPDAERDETDADEAGGGSPALSRFAVVGPEGLEDGCGCGVFSAPGASVGPQPSGRFGVLLCLVVVLAHHRRRLRTGRARC